MGSHERSTNAPVSLLGTSGRFCVEKARDPIASPEPLRSTSPIPGATSQIFDELMVVVFCMLSAQDLCRAESVCRKWQKIVASREVQEHSGSELVRFAKYARDLLEPQKLNRPPDLPSGSEVDPDPFAWPGLTWDFVTLKDGRWVLSYGINPEYEASSALYVCSADGDIIQTLEVDEDDCVLACNETHVYAMKGHFENDAQYALHFFDIWALDGMKRVARIRTGCSLLCFTVSPNGTIYGGSYNGEIRVFSPTGSKMKTILGHTDHINCMLLWKDRLFSGGRDGTICIWETTWHTHLVTLSGVTFAVMSLCVAEGVIPRLCSGSFGGDIDIWSMDGTHLQKLVGHTHSVSALVCSPSRRLYSASEDETIRVWNLSGTLLETIDCDEEIDTLAWSQSGHLYSAGLSDLGVRIW